MAEIPESRTLALKRLVVEALNAASYTVSGTVFDRPAGLTVLDHPIHAVNASDLPAIGVYPALEDPVTSTASGVGDRLFTLEIECAGLCFDTPPDAAVDQLRSWALIAVYNNEAVRAAASRDIPRIGRTVWPEPPGEPGERVSVAKVLQRVTLSHRTPYANPTLQG